MDEIVFFNVFSMRKVVLFMSVVLRGISTSLWVEEAWKKSRLLQQGCRLKLKERAGLEEMPGRQGTWTLGPAILFIGCIALQFLFDKHAVLSCLDTVCLDTVCVWCLGVCVCVCVHYEPAFFCLKEADSRL